MCNNVWYFTFMKIKIYELICKRRLQWKKLIEILSEATICQSHHFLKNLRLYSSGEAEKMLVARTFEKNLRFEKKLADEFEFEKTFIWWHSLVRKTQIFWEISDLRKSQRWWPRGLVYIHIDKSQEYSNRFRDLRYMGYFYIHQRLLHTFPLSIPSHRHNQLHDGTL